MPPILTLAFDITSAAVAFQSNGTEPRKYWMRATLRPPRIPIRTPAVAATDRGRRTPERAGGEGAALGPRPPARTPRPASIVHHRAQPLGHLGRSRVPSEQRPIRANHGCSTLRPPRVPIRPTAVAATEHGRRAAGRAAGERAARSTLSQPEVTDRHYAAGVPAARRHPGEVAARRRSPLTRTNIGRHPPTGTGPIMDAGTSRPPRIPIRPPAVAATGDGRRMRVIRDV